MRAADLVRLEAMLVIRRHAANGEPTTERTALIVVALQALATPGFLALGMLVGNQIGAGLGLSYEPNATSAPLVPSLRGAAIGVLGLTVAWSMPDDNSRAAMIV